MQGSTILVTGAASGIGKACVERLLRQGARVVAFDRDESTLRTALSAPAEAIERLAGDVSRADDCAAAVQAAVARFGALDGVIHCAAIHSSRYWTDLGAEELNRVLAVNVTGSFLIAQAAARQMVTQRRGAIVLTSSSNIITGGVGGQAGLGGPAYVASKAAIVGLVRSLARSVGPDGIRVNGIAPGVTDTPMIANYSAEHRAAQATRAVLGHIAGADEIADVACFLAGDGARYMTGEVVIVNGGANFG
jgi:NAD(P)-dependent dehydrogenase (short-subunit alcohol dehydrogenase family)